MIKNKFIVVALLFIFSCGLNSEAQSGYIVIDSLHPGITKVDLHNTLVSCDTGLCDTSYPFDFDKNGMEDLKFRLFGSSFGSSGTSVVMLLTSSDSCFFFDSVGKGYLVINSMKDTSVFSTPVVKMLNFSDTLYRDSCQASSSKFVQTENPPDFHYISYVNEWVSGIHVFGFKKIKNNKVFLGWVKLEIINYFLAVIKEYAIETLPLGINTVAKPLPFLYPNPTNDQLIIKNSSCRKIEIYNCLGNLVLTEENRNPSSLFYVNIANLSNGMYFIKLFELEKEGYTTEKLIKQ